MIPPHRPRPRRVLVDLSHAAAGYVGIAQDIRLVFDMLCDLPNVDPIGLLMPTARHDLPRIHAGAKETAAAHAGVLHWMNRNWASRHYPRALGRFGGLVEVRSSLRSRHDVVSLGALERTDAIWRILFEKTLPAARRATILAAEFQATDLSVMRIIDRMLRFPSLPPKRLRVSGCDAVLFCMPRPVRLPPGVTPIMRFHDAVPLTDPDTVETWRTGLVHQRLVQRCARETIFVCNSPPTFESLARLSPEHAANARVIPCAIAPPPVLEAGIAVTSIVERRRSRSLFEGNKALAPLPVPASRQPRYVLSVSSLEPRKNFAGLVRGWERVISRSDPDLRLMLVANRGWLEDQSIAAMRPHLRSGRILHLENVPADELWTLYRKAACLAFPSFNEGFGYAPLEALQAGTASLVSDLPVFRWTFGDAAHYVDPYDPEAIAQGIERLAVGPSSGDACAALLAGREKVLERFRPSTVAQLWSDLFDHLPGR